MKKINDTFTLHNGVKIPSIGFGTWQIPDGYDTISLVSEALQVGYRHIDTASIYKNECGVGTAIRESGIPREEIFVTSKLWNRFRGYDLTMQAFEETMDKLGLDYLDLYLIHWPAVAKLFDNPEKINLSTWRAFTELYKSGRIKAIGVSNFLPHHLEPLMESEIIPMVNQIEYHPGYLQKQTVDFCKKNGIIVEAWSPLGCGRMLQDETLISIAKKYEKSVAQLCIRFCIQNDLLPLPKTSTISRVKENIAVYDFNISESDMAIISAIENKGFSGFNPDNPDF